MIPKIVCGNCGNEIGATDKYCSSCGTSVESRAAAPPSRAAGETARGNGAPLPCPLCGQKNDSSSAYCESCGAALRSGSAPRREQAAAKHAPAHKLPPLKILQSWKLTLGLAVVLIATLVIMKSSRTGSSPAQDGASAHASG